MTPLAIYLSITQHPNIHFATMCSSKAEPPPEVAARIDQETSVSSLDYHPTTLLLSGFGTLAMIVVMLICYCGAKRFLSLMRQTPQAQLGAAFYNAAAENVYAQPGQRMPNRNM